MTTQPLSALLIEDSPDDAVLIARELGHAGYDVHWKSIDQLPDLRACLASEHWDIVLSDHSMTEMSSEEALTIVKEHDPELPFIIVDKPKARVLAFDADGHLLGASPALLGLARGDDSVPGIGERPMADIRPEERTTPAGRFAAEMGRNANGEDILWVDYEHKAWSQRHETEVVEDKRAAAARQPSPSGSGKP